MDRRNFLVRASATAGAIALGGGIEAAEGSVKTTGDLSPGALPPAETFRKGEMIYRMLGSTGEKVSAIGMGGFHVSKPATDDEAVTLVRTAIDRGITFLDNCWDYAEGLSEIRVGKALRDGYRKKVFLMTKIDGRDKKTAAKQIDESLLRLGTDHVDLMQFHEIIRLEDPDRVFSEGGAIEAMLDAKKAGKVRFIGFTGHKDPYVHLRMLETAAAHSFKFDTVQMPLNVMDAHFRSFEKQVLPKLVGDKIGVLGMKSLGDNFILQSSVATAPECLRYSLSLPTSVVITGIEKKEILDQALQVAKDFKQMSREEMASLLSKTRDAAMTGKFEKFKTESHSDGTAKNPKWLGGAQEPQ
jgi:aryl-alcohol dehydrogenase-like predicted oxidoreductase